MNWLLYFIFFVILISNDILLFNEEFLILLCFIIFCILIYNNLKKNIYDYFEASNNHIKKKYWKFYDKILTSFQNEIFYKKKIFNFSNNISNLKRYYLNLNIKFLNNILDYQIKEKQIIFKHKLNFALSLEQQFQKLIISIVLIKIKKLLILTLFLKKTITINNLKCINRIILLEYIKKI